MTDCTAIAFDPYVFSSGYLILRSQNASQMLKEEVLPRAQQMFAGCSGNRRLEYADAYLRSAAKQFRKTRIVYSSFMPETVDGVHVLSDYMEYIRWMSLDEWVAEAAKKRVYLNGIAPCQRSTSPASPAHHVNGTVSVSDLPHGTGTDSPTTLDPATLAALVSQLPPGQTLEIEIEHETDPKAPTPQDTLQALIERLRQPSPALEALRQTLSQPTNALTQELETLSQQAYDLAQALQTLLKRIKPAPDGSVDAG